MPRSVIASRWWRWSERDRGRDRGGPDWPAPIRNARSCWESLLLDGEDQLERGRPAGLDLVAGDRATDGIAVGVEGGRSKDGRQILCGHDGLEDLVPVVGGGLLEGGQG